VIALGGLALVAIGASAMIVSHRAAESVTQLQAGDILAPQGGYVLGKSSVLAGQGAKGQTRVRLLPWGQVSLQGPVISSADLAEWKDSGRGRWAHEGVPTGIVVRDLAIEGQGSVPSNGFTFQPDPRPRASHAAVDLYAPGAVVQNVTVNNYPGVAVMHDQGAGPLEGQQDLTDSGATSLTGITTLRCHTGVWVKNSSDGVADLLDLLDGGDFGARFDGGAWRISRVHAAGYLAPATAENPDLGVGIINGNVNYFGDNIQLDHCRIGFRNYGTGSTADEIVCKLCIEQSLHLVKRMSVARLTITTPGGVTEMPHFNPAPRGVVIEPTAAGSVIGDATSDVSTGDATSAVMFVVRANRCEITNGRMSWGFAKQNTLVEYGSPTEKLSGSKIDVWATGYDCGVRLSHKIGKGNTIVVHFTSACPTPIDLGPNVDLRGNDVRIEDATTGAWTVIATKNETTKGQIEGDAK
jgi:hypothetical protein